MSYAHMHAIKLLATLRASARVRRTSAQIPGQSSLAVLCCMTSYLRYGIITYLGDAGVRLMHPEKLRSCEVRLPCCVRES